MSWAGTEFETIDLGDERRNKRAIRLVERLSAQPMASVPQACGDWADTMAAYRFFDNEAVDWRAILVAHTDCAMTRMAEHEVVLCIQDTTELDFNGQEASGLGPLSYEAQRGMYAHPTYAVSTSREPLGVLDAWMWARELKDKDASRPGVKESVRWVEGYERLAEMAPQLPDTRLVYLADREADIMALMVKAQGSGTPVDWLVRSQHNRALKGGDKLWARVSGGQALGELRFTLPSRHGCKAREVVQQVWAQTVELPDGAKGQVQASCIVAREMQPPQGEKPIEWRLLTNLPVGSLEQAARLIDWYRARWETRDVLSCPQKRLPHRGAAAGQHREDGARAGAVHGGGLAHCPPHAPGARLSGLERAAHVRARRVAGSVHPEQKTPAGHAAHTQRGGAPGSPARRLSGAHGRWRAGRQNHLAGHAAHFGLRHWRQVLTRTSGYGELCITVASRTIA